ncbi:MAG: DUF721 domain-containing protein [Magnetococcus sp. DMHC-1]|nr:DUF721 domain-containing protein [Magnetococcales bacterium]
MPPRIQRTMIPLGEVIPQLTHELLDHPVGRAQRLWREWVTAVGPQLAQHTEPLRLSDGTLTIRVDSPAWKNELEFIKHELLERLAPLLPPGSLQRILLKQGTLRFLQKTQRPPPNPDSVSWPPPLPNEIQQAQSQVTMVADPMLQEILYRIALKRLIRTRIPDKIQPSP